MKDFKKVFSPKNLYIINLIGAISNLVFAITAIYLHLGSGSVNMFILSGFCFTFGAIMNLIIISTSKNNNKEK